jgi:hypothetical protein
VVIYLEPRHILKTHQKKLEIGNVLIGTLDEDERIVCVLKMGDAPGQKVRSQAVNMTGLGSSSENTRQGLANEVFEKFGPSEKCFADMLELHACSSLKNEMTINIPI